MVGLARTCPVPLMPPYIDACFSAVRRPKRLCTHEIETSLCGHFLTQEVREDRVASTVYQDHDDYRRGGDEGNRTHNNVIIAESMKMRQPRFSRPRNVQMVPPISTRMSRFGSGLWRKSSGSWLFRSEPQAAGSGAREYCSDI